MQPPTSDELPVVHVSEGDVPLEVEERAEAIVRSLAARAPRPVLFARVKLISEHGRVGDDQAVAQATMDVSGRLIRAQSAAPTMAVAVNGLADRLDRRLRRVTERLETAEIRPPRTPEGEWRHGDLPTERPDHYPRPVDERRVVRHKSYGPATASIEEALFDLDVLDYRFFLFTDSADGVDSIVYETPEGVALRRIDGSAPADDLPQGLEWNQAPAPEYDLDKAIERIEASDEPFVFFVLPGSTRGRALYRRYDGHYGVIEPRT